MSKFSDANPLVTKTVVDERVGRVEEAIRVIENRLANSYLQGRIRFDRTAPIDSADVQSPDRLYDIVRIYPYEYVLINNAGTLNWVRITMSTF
jgi:hypothetical protein